MEDSQAAGPPPCRGDNLAWEKLHQWGVFDPTTLLCPTMVRAIVSVIVEVLCGSRKITDLQVRTNIRKRRRHAFVIGGPVEVEVKCRGWLVEDKENKDTFKLVDDTSRVHPVVKVVETICFVDHA